MQYRHNVAIVRYTRTHVYTHKVEVTQTVHACVPLYLRTYVRRREFYIRIPIIILYTIITLTRIFPARTFSHSVLCSTVVRKARGSVRA